MNKREAYILLANLLNGRSYQLAEMDQVQQALAFLGQELAAYDKENPPPPAPAVPDRQKQSRLAKLLKKKSK